MAGAPDDREGLSIVTVVMNRPAQLAFTAPKISRWSGHHEHLILDWSSDPPVQRESLPADGRIRLFRVEGENRWHLTRAYNFAITMAQGPVILKLDADCWLTENGVPWWPELEPSTYQRSASGGGMNGIVLIRRQDFLDAGGFHEGLHGYGYDDKDLYSRLERKLKCRFLALGRFFTLEHGDVERVASQNGLKGLPSAPADASERVRGRHRLAALEAIARMEESKATNRQLAERWPWSPEHPRTVYEPLGSDGWRAVPATLPIGDPATVREARALGNRVYLSVLLGLPERFLDQQVPAQDLARIRSWDHVLRLQAYLRMLMLMPMLRQGVRLHSWLAQGRQHDGRGGRS